MSSSKCARCDQTVYPVEGLRCLDKVWHKSCFKCHECNMTLNMKNYKGFEKRPYCNAHCPQAKATTVADTPEIRRLAENTRIQSQAKYHEDFEKSKGKGFTAIADDPETLRIKETSKIISNVAYHGELERKKQMEEKRGRSGSEDSPVGVNSGGNINNNNDDTKNISKYQSSIQVINVPHKQPELDYAIHQPSQTNPVQNQYQMQHQRQLQQQMHQQQQLHKQQQQQQQQQQQLQHEKHKQQQLQIKQQQHQMHFAQDLNGQPNVGRHSLPSAGHLHPSSHPQQQQQLFMKQMQQYPMGQHAYQQQMAMRQQQQQFQQQQMMLQQQRQSSEPNMLLNRQPVKQANHHPQQMMKQQMTPAQAAYQQQMKYVSMNDAMMHRPQVHHVGSTPAATHQIISKPELGAMPNGQRLAANQVAMMAAGPQGAHHMVRGYNLSQVAHMSNGVAMQKQPPQIISSSQPPRHIIHPSHMQQMNHPQIRPSVPTQQQVPLHPQQLAGRVFRAIYDYMANDVDEVSFFENDILVDCVNVDRNWLIGKVARSGETGMLPANYVAELPSQ